MVVAEAGLSAISPLGTYPWVVEAVTLTTMMVALVRICCRFSLFLHLSRLLPSSCRKKVIEGCAHSEGHGGHAHSGGHRGLGTQTEETTGEWGRHSHSGGHGGAHTQEGSRFSLVPIPTRVSSRDAGKIGVCMQGASAAPTSSENITAQSISTGYPALAGPERNQSNWPPMDNPLPNRPAAWLTQNVILTPSPPCMDITGRCPHLLDSVPVFTCT